MLKTYFKIIFLGRCQFQRPLNLGLRCKFECIRKLFISETNFLTLHMLIYVGWNLLSHLRIRLELCRLNIFMKYLSFPFDKLNQTVVLKGFGCYVVLNLRKFNTTKSRDEFYPICTWNKPSSIGVVVSGCTTQWFLSFFQKKCVRIEL